MRRIIHAFWVVLALLFLLEAWLWEKLAPMVAFVVGFIPLRRIKANVAAFVEQLPPAVTLVVFVIPAAVLLPIKIGALWLFGLRYAGAAKAATLSSTAPVFAAPLAVLFLGERLTPQVGVGILLTIAGIWLVI